MLKNSLKIWDTTKKFFEQIFFLSDQKIWQRYCCEDVSDLSDPLTWWPSISVLTTGFLGIWVTPLFAVYNLKKNYLWGSTLFSKYFKFYVDSGNAWQKIQKIFFDFEIDAFQLVALDSFFSCERIHFTACQYVSKQYRDLRYY